jgi:lysozyme
MTVPVDVPVPPGAKSVDIRLNFVPAPTPKEIPQRGAPGIDVSRHQGTVDWDKVKEAGKVFAGIRATMGATGRDDQFARNWKEAKRVGILRMAYHYFTNNFPGTPQLDNFLNALGGDYGELRIVLDIEPRKISDNPPAYEAINNQASNTNEVFTWLAECEKRTGKRPAVYSNRTGLTYCTTMPDKFGQYPFWIAAYNNLSAPMLYRPWTRYMAWQYSATGKVLGIAGDVDLDRWGEL